MRQHRPIYTQFDYFESKFRNYIIEEAEGHDF